MRGAGRRRFEKENGALILKRTLNAVGLVLAVYILTAYFVLPAIWKHYEHHPAMENSPKVTRTKEGIPADPLNVGLIASQPELILAMSKAGWLPADPITAKSSVGILESVVTGRAYPDAPVSHLYLWGRIQDLAFEKPAGSNARERHHVRFWKSHELGLNQRPLWIGAATFDRSVGMSHRTGQLTHHISPDIDAERDLLIHDLNEAGQLALFFQVTGVGLIFRGRNGGGDPYFTNGELSIGVLMQNHLANDKLAEKLPDPPAVELKNQIWTKLRQVFAG